MCLSMCSDISVLGEGFTLSSDVPQECTMTKWPSHLSKEAWTLDGELIQNRCRIQYPLDQCQLLHQPDQPYLLPAGGSAQPPTEEEEDTPTHTQAGFMKEL